MVNDKVDAEHASSSEGEIPMNSPRKSDSKEVHFRTGLSAVPEEASAPKDMEEGNEKAKVALDSKQSGPDEDGPKATHATVEPLQHDSPLDTPKMNHPKKASAKKRFRPLSWCCCSSCASKARARADDAASNNVIAMSSAGDGNGPQPSLQTAAAACAAHVGSGSSNQENPEKLDMPDPEAQTEVPASSMNDTLQHELPEREGVSAPDIEAMPQKQSIDMTETKLGADSASPPEETNNGVGALPPKLTKQLTEAVDNAADDFQEEGEVPPSKGDPAAT
jgi:hypothetical protein